MIYNTHKNAHNVLHVYINEYFFFANHYIPIRQFDLRDEFFIIKMFAWFNHRIGNY